MAFRWPGGFSKCSDGREAGQIEHGEAYLRGGHGALDLLNRDSALLRVSASDQNFGFGSRQG